jgi:ATP-dependent DNA helicase DinG
MQDFFSPEGLLAKKLDGYEPRPSQEQMARIVEDALENRNHAIVEAGTGTGKTLAYLVPALFHNQRLLVSTGTKALQDQIFYKDIPLLETILDRPIRAAYLKGRSNYLCKLKLNTFQQEGLFTPIELDDFQEISDWSRKTETGDRAELDMVSDDDELWSRLDARREHCLGSKCEEFESCFLTLMRQKAMESDIVVVNHHLFFADLAIRESEMAQILPDYTAVIFDEAHEIEDIATSYFGFHVSNYRLQELLFDARSIAQASEAQIETDSAALMRTSDHFFGRFMTLRDGRHPMPDLVGIDGLIDALGDIRRTFKQQIDPDGEWGNLRRRAGELESELQVFKDGNPDNYVSWLDRKGRGVFLEACPVDVAPLLAEALFDKVPTCILTSATLTVGGSTNYIRKRLGLHAAEAESLSTEFDFQKQAALYIPHNLPDYRNSAYVRLASDEIKKIVEVSEGRAFVLFTSYQQMQACYQMVADRLPYPTLLQGRTSRSRLLEQFRSKDNAVLFATSSFWQGIDVRGEALSCVIIDKLPFQVPSDPLVQARIRQIEEDGGNAFADYQVPAAILRLKQGFGRLIRSRTDKGILAILDSRLRTRGYGKLFMASLPDYAIVDKVEGLREFLHGDNAKDAEDAKDSEDDEAELDR